MLGKSKKQIELSLQNKIQTDFDKIRNLPYNNRIKAINKLISNVLKAAIGQPLEYTIEESLYILNKDIKIPKEEYDKLKKILIFFAYSKYSNNTEEISIEKLNKLESEFVKILPFMIPKNNEINALQIYETEKNKKKTVPEDNKKQTLLKEHKNNLLEEEKIIIKELKEQNNNNKISTINKDKEFDKIEKNIESTFEFENKSYNSAINNLQNKAPIFVPKQEEINDKEFADLIKIKMSFKAIFENTTGFNNDEINNYKFNSKKIPLNAWDLHIKYHLLKGDSIDQIKINYEKKIKPEIMKKLIEENNNYLDKIKSYSYLRSMQGIIIILTLTILFGKDLNYEAKQLIKKGFKKNEVNLVMENILK